MSMLPDFFTYEMVWARQRELIEFADADGRRTPAWALSFRWAQSALWSLWFAHT